MTLLVISPDYASHLLPLATLATAWRDAGERVVVATGPATDPIVREFGFERYDLPLGRGSNPGVIRAEEQPDDESDSLRGFFDATRRGMVPTLRYQASERLTDLMWDPVDAGRRVLAAVVDAVRPDAIIVDHLAFSARLALQTAGIPYADVVLGHPSALPVAGEVYGYPPFWPAAFAPDSAELADLRALCDEVSARFTAEWNRAARDLDPAAPLTDDAFGEHGDLVLYNYPADLAERRRTHSCRRTPSSAPPAGSRRSTTRSRPGSRRPPEFAYVSFGSFLSVRGDVLRRVAEALVEIGMPAAIATGSTPRRRTRARSRRAGSCASTCRRCGCCAGRGSPSPTAATTPSPRRSDRGFRCSCCRSRPTSSPERPPIERTGIGRALDPNAAIGRRARRSADRGARSVGKPVAAVDRPRTGRTAPARRSPTSC